MTSRGIKFFKVKILNGKHITEIHYFNGDIAVREEEHDNNTSAKDKKIKTGIICNP